MRNRQVVEGRQSQGVDESLSYSITTTPWGSGPSGVTVVAKDITDPHNAQIVTGDVLTGSATVNADVITLPQLGSLTAGHKYRVEIEFTDSNTNIWEAYIEVWADE